MEEIIHLPENQNDLYLFTTIAVPWVADTSRDLGTPELRKRMQEALLDALKQHGAPCVMIDKTDYNVRFQRAVNATVQLLAQTPAF